MPSKSDRIQRLGLATGIVASTTTVAATSSATLAFPTLALPLQVSQRARILLLEANIWPTNAVGTVTLWAFWCGARTFAYQPSIAFPLTGPNLLPQLLGAGQVNNALFMLYEDFGLVLRGRDLDPSSAGVITLGLNARVASTDAAPQGLSSSLQIWYDLQPDVDD